jgi:pimeloyl-ACP methyl ester carboxylesterase
MWTRILLVVVLQAGALQLHFGAEPEGGETPSFGWLSQTLDHFNFDPSHAQFQQRFLINDSFWKPGAAQPIYVFIGPEAPLPASYSTSLCLPVRLAEQYGGLVVSLEHRYFGASLPFGGNISAYTVDQLRFLTPQQALADLAAFVSWVRDTYSAWNSPAIAFGGSYPGALAAWFRIKYPHVVIGALASAAPINVTVNSNYRSGILQVYTETCGPIVPTVWSELHRLAVTSPATLLRAFDWMNLTAPLYPSQLFNRLGFFFQLGAIFNYGIEFAWPYAMPLNVLCGRLSLTSNVTDAIQVVSTWARESRGLGKRAEPLWQQGYVFWPQLVLRMSAMLTCVNFCRLDSHTTVAPSLTGRAWLFESVCSQFGVGFNIDDLASGFFYNTTVAEALKINRLTCEASYGPGVYGEPQPGRNSWINSYYGGPNITSSRIIFSHGYYDPTRFVSVSHSVPGQPWEAFVIPGVAHGADLCYFYPDEPAPLTAAIKRITMTIMSWVADFHNRHVLLVFCFLGCHSSSKVKEKLDGNNNKLKNNLSRTLILIQIE